MLGSVRAVGPAHPRHVDGFWVDLPLSAKCWRVCSWVTRTGWQTSRSWLNKVAENVRTDDCRSARCQAMAVRCQGRASVQASWSDLGSGQESPVTDLSAVRADGPLNLQRLRCFDFAK